MKDTSHLTPELIRSVNTQRASSNKPMLSWEGFQAACLKLNLDLATVPQDQAITQLVGYEIPSSLMSTYSSSYQVPNEATQQGAGSQEQGGQGGQGQGTGQVDQERANQQQQGDRG